MSVAYGWFSGFGRPNQVANCSFEFHHYDLFPVWSCILRFAMVGTSRIGCDFAGLVEAVFNANESDITGCDEGVFVKETSMKILVAVDPSQHAREAIQFVKSVEWPKKSKIFLLHVIEMKNAPPLMPSDGPFSWNKKKFPRQGEK